MRNFRDRICFQRYQRGFNLMEVLIGIIIFAIGMLALASLQGALTRSTAEAKVRTTAVNIAERILEGQMGFALLSSTDPAELAYTNIVDVPIESAITFDSEMTRNPTTPVGTVYTVTQDVTDYYYDLASDAFITTAPTGVTIPDYKTVAVTVAWDSGADFIIDETQQAGNLGGGSVEVSTTISNVSVAAALKVNEETDEDIIAPSISYTPGLNPDIVSLSLGDSKFKESLSPEPKVYRDNLETRFDVVTYSQSGGDALFLRREEFVAVSCECTLRDANADLPGRTPTLWAGDEYTEPDLVTKPYGEVIADVAQSPLCEACCRDHHDVAGSPVYDPSRPLTEYADGNHKHYSKSPKGLVEATVGDDYVEACRLVRKDGFFRVAQDFRLEGLNTFAGDYLITEDQVNSYSKYVTEEVYVKDDTTSYVPRAIELGTGYQLAPNPPTVDTAPRTASDGSPSADDLTLGYTYLPTAGLKQDFQQLRSRSIYIDNLSPDLRAVIDCIENKTEAELQADPLICKSGDVELDQTGSYNVLEIIPFFEIQTTYLNDWQKEKIGGIDFTLTNEVVTTSDANGPTHSRGLATKVADNGNDMVHTIANRGNIGLTSTDPINNIDYVLPAPEGSWPPGDIEVIIGADSSEPSGRTITGTLISSVGGLRAANITMTATNAICNYITASGVFTCFIPTSGNTPKITITGFQKPPKTVYVCSSHQFNALGSTPGELEVKNNNDTGSQTKDIDLTYALETPESPAEPYVIWIDDEPCPTGGGGIGF